ncbi:MAG: AbgT family transporter [Defluviitaleaceae bacterium]|nr:AbgT family transporter [Defluviitaleaceae bacterium]
MNKTDNEKKTFVNKFLDGIEKIGNKVPDPFILFAFLTGLLIVFSAIMSWAGVSVTHPTTGQEIQPLNLMSSEGIRTIFSSVVSNFTGFAPLGMVLTIMLGLGVLERTGLLGTALKSLVMAAPKKIITATLVFASIMSSIATDAGYVVLIPLGAAIFASMGRHPLAGLAAAFAGVAGGFSANLLVTPLDTLLVGITQQAVDTFDPTYEVLVTGNWFFMAFSHIFLTIVITILTEKFVEPRLGEYKGEFKEEITEITAEQKRGMKLAGLSMLIVAGLASLLIIPSWGPMRGVDGAIIASPFFSHLVPILFIFFLVPGIVYGKVIGSIKKSGDVTIHMTKTMESMAGFLVLAFAAGQFVGLFAQSNLGIILAISGSDLLQALGFTGFPLILTFMLIATTINLFIGSASAQWLLMAPIFVPIMMDMGFTPEFTLVAYRVADSSTTVITPLLTYFAMILAFARKYVKESGVGSIISMMFPYSVVIFVLWTLILLIWMVLGLPIGPGVPIRL